MHHADLDLLAADLEVLPRADTFRPTRTGSCGVFGSSGLSWASLM
ncbi:hypothetical protein ACIBL8_41825 [Streptomyces sp. NPDC050523]